MILIANHLRLAIANRQSPNRQSPGEDGLEEAKVSAALRGFEHGRIEHAGAHDWKYERQMIQDLAHAGAIVIFPAPEGRVEIMGGGDA